MMPAPSGAADFGVRFRRSRQRHDRCGHRRRRAAGSPSFGPFFVPHDPNKVNMLAVWRPPDDTYWLGADALGRDVFSRIVVGARVSLTVAMSVLAIHPGPRHHPSA